MWTDLLPAAHALSTSLLRQLLPERHRTCCPLVLSALLLACTTSARERAWRRRANIARTSPVEVGSAEPPSSLAEEERSSEFVIAEAARAEEELGIRP